MCFLLTLASLSILSDNFLDLIVQLLDVVVVVTAGGLKISNALLHLVLALLSHKGLAHSVSDRALVKSLISLDGHLDFVTDTHEEEASLSAVDGDLTDQFIEALGEELLTVWADSGLSGLTALDSSIELILKIDNVDLSGGLGRDVTHPEGTALRELSRR